MSSVDLRTNGMHCSSCPMLVDMTVGELPGVAAVETSFANGQTHVEFDPTVVSLDRIIAAIAEAGYKAEASLDADRRGGTSN